MSQENSDVIDLHIHVGSVFAFLGIVALTGFIAYLIVIFTVLLTMDSGRGDWIGFSLAVIEFFGGTWLLGWWAGLW